MRYLCTRYRELAACVLVQLTGVASKDSRYFLIMLVTFPHFVGSFSSFRGKFLFSPSNFRLHTIFNITGMSVIYFHEALLPNASMY